MNRSSFSKHSILKSMYLYFALSFIFLVSVIFRFLDLGTDLPGLYNDELYFLLSAYAQLNHIGYLTVPGYNLRDFVFYTIDGYIPSIIMFHSNPFSARFPVALYGSLMIFPMYLLAKELFNSRGIALIASFLWAISPSAIITSRVGYGVEIFPLFLFLFFVFFWVKFFRSHQLMYLILSTTFFVPIIFFPSIRTWALIPSIGIVIYTGVPRLMSKFTVKMRTNTTYLYYIVSFFIAIAAIWIALLYGPVVASKFGYNGITTGIPQRFILVSRPFPGSLLNFFQRIGYALAPWKTFWFDEFTAIGLDYGSPVFVPSMLLFALPFFYASIFFIPFLYRKDNKIMEGYFMATGFMFFGLLQPVFNITNPSYGFEPSEGIFALPFIAILSAFSLYKFFVWAFGSLKLRKDKGIRQNSTHTILLNIRPKRRIFAASLIILLLLFAGLNVATFSSDLFISSNAYYQDNSNSIYYIFYGWDHVAEYLVDSHLYNETLYYTPGKGGIYNLTNVSNFNYWFWHQNFPLYWLYVYSNGLIKKIYPLYPGSIPPVPMKSAIVLSQNASYTDLLTDNGISSRVLCTVYRADGIPAIQVIQIYNMISYSERMNMIESNIFYATNVSGYETFNISQLEQLSQQFTVSVKFSIPPGQLSAGGKYNLMGSFTPTFSLGIWPEDIFIHPGSNSSFVPVGDIYTDYGNYSAPNTWDRIYGTTPLTNNTVYMLTMTFDNGLMNLYLNSSLLGYWKLDYPLYPLNPPIIYLDYNINATIIDAGIWNIALNAGEIGYMNYDSLPFNNQSR